MPTAPATTAVVCSSMQSSETSLTSTLTAKCDTFGSHHDLINSPGSVTCDHSSQLEWPLRCTGRSNKPSSFWCPCFPLSRFYLRMSQP